MTDGYIPSCLADESSPPPREHPDDWVIERAGKFYLDEGNDELAEQEHELEDHELLVEGKSYDFMRLENFGDAMLTIAEDGSFSVAPEMPAGAEQVMVEFEPDTLSNSVAELVNNDDLDTGEHDLSYFTWNDEVWTFAGGKFTRGAA